MAVNSAPRTLDCDHQGNPPGLPCPSPTSNGLTGLHYNIQTLIHSIQSSLGFCLYLFIPKKIPIGPIISYPCLSSYSKKKCCNAGCLSQMFIILSSFFTHTLGLFEGSRLPTTKHQAISRPRHGVRPGRCGFRASSARGESQHMETLGHGELREYHGIIMEIS